MTQAVPTDAIRLIQEFEGCHRFIAADDLVHAYPDPLSGGEPFTIGWGTTVYPDGRRVGSNDAITREDADKFFVTTLQEKYWEPISRSIPYWGEMHDKMRSALCSFAYNLGAGFYGAEGFRTISACLTEQRWDDVPAALMLYVNPGSNVEAGLRRRRDAEGDLWRQGQADLQRPAPTAPIRLLETITDTFLKKENLDSTQLGPHQLVPVEKGRQWKIEETLATEGNSEQVRLAYGAGDWWIYRPHWKEVTGEVEVEPPPTPGPGREEGDLRPHLLDVPYLSQLDNVENPYGSCNVTCVAMCLYYLGMPRRTGVQLEDELYRKLEGLGRSRHNPYDLKYLIETYPGYKDIFRENGGIQDIQASLDADHPVIIHGYFTSFGHIIVVCGYDDTGFIVNDPYGEWFSTGYDNSRSGEKLHYSYGLIARTCSPESQANPQNIWYHSVSRV
ncbi:MAG: C39 family peptidase [Synechococcaceae cyanobacterium]|nr:C39 family peptidase [Synechococcaceae cyanobacterium]